MFEGFLRSISKTPLSRRRVRASHEGPLRGLRNKLRKAIHRGSFEDALAALTSIESIDTSTPRWPHKRGDILHQLQRDTEAFFAYAQAVRLYVEIRRPRLAEAMARTALAVAPGCSGRLNELDAVSAAVFRAAMDTDSLPESVDVIGAPRTTMPTALV